LKQKNLEEAIRARKKKMLRAEKRKFNDQKSAYKKYFSNIISGENLQNPGKEILCCFSAKDGITFFQMLYENSLTLELGFCG